MLEGIYNYIVLPWILIGLITFFALLKVRAPYGKFSNKNWGPLISFELGWFLQEIVSPITFSYFFLTGTIEQKSIAWFFFLLWNLHYFNRSIIFPLRKKHKSFCPVSVVFMAIFFNLINGFINGYYLGNIFSYDYNYLFNINFIAGLSLFCFGMGVNIYADNILLKLKKNHVDGYQIPIGGLYKYISCPNYFGEIIEWLGFALMTWSVPALAFALWTIFNLAPRAISQHKWYNEKFKDYPKNRKAIVPFII